MKRSPSVSSCSALESRHIYDMSYWHSFLEVGTMHFALVRLGDDQV